MSKIDSFESSWPITSNRGYESSYFLVCNLFLWSSSRKSYFICQENSDMAKLWPFKTKFWPFLAKIDCFGSFWPITSKRSYESSYFLELNFFEFWLFSGNQSYYVLLVWKLFCCSSFRKSYSICLENSDLAKFWPFKTKIWPFLAKIYCFESFWPITSKRSYESSYFLVLNFFEFWLFPGNQSYCVLLYFWIRLFYGFNYFSINLF